MFSGLASALHLTYLIGNLTVQSYICQPPAAPEIVTPIDGTSVNASVPFLVAGNGPPKSTITIASNGTPIVSVQADDSNHFSASVTLANEGAHTLSVQASRPCGSALGNEITVQVGAAPVTPVDPVDPATPTEPGQSSPNTPQPPSKKPTLPLAPELPKPPTSSDDQNTSNNLYLVINTPANHSTTTDSSVFINGTISAPATVEILVNGTSVGATHVLLASFGMGVPLEIGENSIEIKAKNTQGSASVKLSVTRQATEVQIPWYNTESGQTAIRIAVISLVTILVVLVIIGIILL